MAAATAPPSMDDFTFALSLQTSLLGHDHHGAPIPDDDDDEDTRLAMEIWAAELTAQQQILDDARIAREMDGGAAAATAVDEARTIQEEEAPAVTELLVADKERQEEEDRALAERLHNDLNGSVGYEDMPDLLTEPEETTSSASASGSGSTGKTKHSIPYAVFWDGESPRNVSKQVTCSVCLSAYHIPSTARLECTHIYCLTCLHTLLSNSLKDSAAFPPTCCGKTIHPDIGADVLEPDEMEAWVRKVMVPTGAKTVACAGRGCEEVLLPGAVVDDVALCLVCETRTCVHCSQVEHLSSTCASDEDTISLYALADKESWQRCPKCGHFIELKEGCFHMTCRCRHEFCFLCTAKWKTCSCDQASEPTLLARDRPSLLSSSSTTTLPRTISAEERRVHRDLAEFAAMEFRRRVYELRLLRVEREVDRERYLNQIWEAGIGERTRKRKLKTRKAEKRRQDIEEVVGLVVGTAESRRQESVDWVVIQEKGKGKQHADVDERPAGCAGIVERIVDLVMLYEQKDANNPSIPFIDLD